MVVSAVDSKMLVTGFEAARARFLAAASDVDAEHGFHALFEVVAWGGAVLDRREKVEKKPLCPELQGLWYVRNLIIHRGTDARTWSVILPAIGWGDAWGEAWGGRPEERGWTWPERRYMPPHQSDKGLQQYETHLAGKVITETLATVSEFLAKCP
jgi:hypothetical protein